MDRQIPKQSKTLLAAKLLRLVYRFPDKKIGNFASSTAFFFFISLIPMCIIASAFLPYTGISEETFTRLITGVTPDVVDGIVTQIINDAFNMVGSLVPLSILAILWASAKGMMAFIRGLNVIYDIRERRNYFSLGLISIVYTIVLVVALFMSFALMVLGQTLKRFIGQHLPHWQILNFVMSNVRYLFVIGLAILFFCLLYTFLPGERQSFTGQIGGAVFAALGWTIFSLIFSALIGHGSIYSTYYGGLAAIVIFLLWLYGCFYILLIGAYINYGLAELLHQSDEGL